jgi:hypothetical protein
VLYQNAKKNSKEEEAGKINKRAFTGGTEKCHKNKILATSKVYGKHSD